MIVIISDKVWIINLLYTLIASTGSKQKLDTKNVVRTSYRLLTPNDESAFVKCK